MFLNKQDIIKLDSWDEVDYAKVEPSQKRILTNQTKKFYLILNAPEEAEIGLTSKTVVIGQNSLKTYFTHVVIMTKKYYLRFLNKVEQ